MGPFYTGKRKNAPDQADCSFLYRVFSPLLLPRFPDDADCLMKQAGMLSLRSCPAARNTNILAVGFGCEDAYGSKIRLMDCRILSAMLRLRQTPVSHPYRRRVVLRRPDWLDASQKASRRKALETSNRLPRVKVF